MGNDDSHSPFISKEGVLKVHAESAGAAVLVELTTLNYCTEEAPIIVRQKYSQNYVRYKNPMSKFFHRN